MKGEMKHIGGGGGDGCYVKHEKWGREKGEECIKRGFKLLK